MAEDGSCSVEMWLLAKVSQTGNTVSAKRRQSHRLQLAHSGAGGVEYSSSRAKTVVAGAMRAKSASGAPHDSHNSSAKGELARFAWTDGAKLDGADGAVLRRTRDRRSSSPFSVFFASEQQRGSIGIDGLDDDKDAFDLTASSGRPGCAVRCLDCPLLRSGTLRTT